MLAHCCTSLERLFCFTYQAHFAPTAWRCVLGVP